MVIHYNRKVVSVSTNVCAISVMATFYYIFSPCINTVSDYTNTKKRHGSNYKSVGTIEQLIRSEGIARTHTVNINRVSNFIETHITKFITVNTPSGNNGTKCTDNTEQLINKFIFQVFTLSLLYLIVHNIAKCS